MGLDLLAFLDEFRIEAAEHLRALDAQLLVLERDPSDPAPVRAMFLAAHSLKGAGAMMDIADVGALAHAVEDVLARLRDGRQRLDQPTADRLFQAIDLLGERVARALPGAAPVDAPITEMIAALAACDGSASAVSPEPPIVMLPPGAGAGETPVALLVEDSQTVRLLHATLLAGVGYAVDLASDGQEALILAGTRHYDLVVSGLETPGLRGPGLAAALHERADGQMPPFILMQNDDAAPPEPAEPFITARLRTEPPGRESLSATVRELLVRAGLD
jgi:CheY-like chemotaxis protein/HPt (histidine-containing phosphotransfer) domain-containing protein